MTNSVASSGRDKADLITHHDSHLRSSVHRSEGTVERLYARSSTLNTLWTPSFSKIINPIRDPDRIILFLLLGIFEYLFHLALVLLSLFVNIPAPPPRLNQLITVHQPTVPRVMLLGLVSPRPKHRRT